MYIVKVEDSTSGEWDDIWKSCETSTYYHSREWAEIWQSYSNGRIRPLPRTITFSDGMKVVLPFSKQSYYGGLISRYSLSGASIGSLPNYGNWLRNGTLTRGHISSLTEYLLNYNNLAWRLNPFDPSSKDVEIDKKKYSQRKIFISYIINLTQGEDVIYTRMDQNCRNKIKQAKKNKLVVREAESINDWKKYFEIYNDTLKRWGAKALYTLNWKFFELLTKVHQRNCKLWLTWYKNIPIAGSICFYSHYKILIWHSSSFTRYLPLRPVNLARYEIIKDGIERGYHWIDFETAGGNKGLIKFKKSFGTDEIRSDRIITWHPVIHYTRKILGR